MACIPPNPRRVEYIDHVHGPVDGPLYMGSDIHQHPPQSELPAQRCSRLDNKKAKTPPQSEVPAHSHKVPGSTGSRVVTL
jgi:hypothetical protein